MNNSVFGKTIKNIRKGQNVTLIDNRGKALKLSSKPNFERSKIFDENLIAVHMKKTEVYFNKPIYIGQAILDLSKTLIKPKYGDKAELLFTDTDSLMYSVQTENFYRDISGDVRKRFDTGDYPEIHPSEIKTGVNKKVIGKFKDEEAGNRLLTLLVFVQSSTVTNLKTTKNWNARALKKNELKFIDYKQCFFFSGEEQMRTMNIIRSDNRDINSMRINKIALSTADDKLIVMENKINTKAFR